jgi:hypothetical protein
MTASQPSKATADHDALTINVAHKAVHHPRWCAR